MTVLDPSRPMARLVLDGSSARPLGSPGNAEMVLEGMRAHAIMCLAAEQAAAAEQRHAATVAYAKRRVQFDRVIGSFQAVKHQLVDLLMLVENAKSAAHGAALAASASADDPAIAVSIAKSVCSDAFMEVARQCLHLHGGIGFTWEHDSHLYFRRAKSSEIILGTPDRHRDRLAAQAGLGEIVAPRGMP